MAYDRQKVIDIALDEVGYLEKATNSNLDSKTGNAGSANYTKYARDLYGAGYYNGNKNGYAWCDVFVDWCFFKAWGKSIGQMLECQTGDLGAGCGYSAQYYKNKGQFHTKNPQPGDQIFFGSASNVTHTGLVYKVTSTKVYTVEGNTSGASGVIANGGGVCEKSYSLSYSKIYGYGRPAYGDNYTATTTAATSNDTISGNIDTVKEVQIWLNSNYTSGLYPDGLYGSLTKKALIKALQKTLGVTADGIYGPNTNKAVRVLKKGSKGDSVSVLQAFLVCNGFTSAYVDGEFGSSTYAALRSYQSKVGIGVDGEAGQETFQKLCT